MSTQISVISMSLPEVHVLETYPQIKMLVDLEARPFELIRIRQGQEGGFP